MSRFIDELIRIKAQEVRREYGKEKEESRKTGKKVVFADILKRVTACECQIYGEWFRDVVRVTVSEQIEARAKIREWNNRRRRRGRFTR